MVRHTTVWRRCIKLYQTIREDGQYLAGDTSECVLRGFVFVGANNYSPLQWKRLEGSIF